MGLSRYFTTPPAAAAVYLIGHFVLALHPVGLYLLSLGCARPQTFEDIDVS